MADEQPPAKQVVKRVVKKKAATTPTRPTQRDTAAPTVRYGRKVTPSIDEPAVKKPAVRTRITKPRTKSGADASAEEKPARKIALPRPAIRRPSASGVKERLGSVGGGFVAAFRRIIAAVSDAFWFVVDTVRSWRLPRLDAVPASLITGVVVGLLSVVLGLGALELFSWLRGVASGGGTWGSLTFVVVAFIAFVAGELLLSGFGVANPRLTSFLGVALTIVVILGLFLEESDTRMAVVIVPAIAATAFTIGHWLMAAAEASAESEE